MKKIMLLSSLLLAGIISFCQSEADSTAPYKRFPTVPPFQLLKVDSSSYFTKSDLKKNKPVLLILFNPDCEHCKHETEEIIKNIDQFKDIQIVMATMMPFDEMKSFYEKYDLKRFDNITVGQDIKYTLPVFYNIRFMPYLAMYNKKGNLLTTFEGSMKIEDLENVFKQIGNYP
ncbi:MAG TPA: thioredoxin fold domain-containing protein [Chitinophagaceae bacterium]|nr:thioredoxin fold domain-containing protein [Chitinophagaceae bacterium]